MRRRISVLLTKGFVSGPVDEQWEFASQEVVICHRRSVAIVLRNVVA